jgi:arsenate reductase
VHLGFDDPAAATGSDDEIMAEFRRVRDEIKEVFGRFSSEMLKQG